MSHENKNRELARGEARAKIQWGAEVQEVADLLHSKYNVSGTEADLMIEEALAARKKLVQKKAGIKLSFAMVGLAVSVTYFWIQRSAGLFRVGAGPALMWSLGLTCLVVGGRSAIEIFTGESPGPVQ